MAAELNPDRSIAALARLAYDELHRQALQFLRLERPHHSLQPTDLVHEAFVKLARSPGADGWQGITHFKSVAANAMRQILVDHARKRLARKRGGSWIHITLAPDLDMGDRQDLDVLALDEALTDLAALDARKSRVVEMRFFSGMTCKEIAEILKISPKTVEADWYFARAWLRARLSEPD